MESSGYVLTDKKRENQMKTLLGFTCGVLLALGAGMAMLKSIYAGSPTPLLTEYPVPGSPLFVAVEAPGRVWFTLPDQNAIGRLVVTSTVEFGVTLFPLPTANSLPYDLEYAGGFVWFTEQNGNKIGRLNLADGSAVEFTVPTSGSQPAGLDVSPGSPTTVWFTERAGNKIGKLVVTDTLTYSFVEYPLPLTGAQPEDIFVQNAGSIWFTAPGVSRIGNLAPSAQPPFALVYTGGGSQPWAIQVDEEGFPWFTDLTGNRLGKFFPQTLADILWYTLPTPNSAPFDLVVKDRRIWFTERDGNRIGQLESPVIREFGLPAGSSPVGIAMDANGCAWIALSGRDRMAAWCPPYFHFVHLPLVFKDTP